MTRCCLLLAPLLAACAPPPPVAGGAADTAADPRLDPAVRIILPPNGSVVPLDADCVARFQVVVDVDNLTIVDFNTPGLEDVMGEGHLHYEVIPPAYAAVPAPFYDAEAAGLTVGDRFTVRATLQTNTHANYDQFPDWESIIELEIGADEGGLCP